MALRWGDQDAYGHVNNVEVLRLIEEARVRAFWRSETPELDLPSAVLELTTDSDTWSLVARLETEYLAPMPYTRAPIDVEVWIGRLGGASIEICFELYSPAGLTPRVLYARSATTIVTVAAGTGRPTRIPGHLREAWAPWIDEPVAFTRRQLGP
jgi:acyl-CoA thioester hydrolase